MNQEAHVKTKYIIYLALAIFMFSTFEVVCKSAKSAISPSQLTFYRFFIGGIILLPFAIRDMRKKKLRLNAKMLLTFTGMGTLLVALSMTLSQIGIAYSTASLTAVLFSSNPLFISLFSCLLLKEQLTSGKLIGLFIGIAGLCVVTADIFITPYQVTPQFILGAVLILIAMLIFSFYSVLNKKLTPHYSTFICVSFASILGSIVLFVFSCIRDIPAGINPLAFDFAAIVPQFLYICIFTTGLAYYFYYDALANLDTGLSSMSFFVKPPLASLLAAVFLKEKITPNLIAGIILILLAVFISVKFGTPEKSLPNTLLKNDTKSVTGKS